mgnify:CR=1 FL=1
MSRSNLRPIKGRITLYAPIDGVMVPMETVPDPVFAQKMVGEGVCVDPLDGRLHAPVDGEVVQLHPSAHALTVRTREGMEILLHIGLDTVDVRPRAVLPDLCECGAPPRAVDIVCGLPYIGIRHPGLLMPDVSRACTGLDGFQAPWEFEV